MSDTAAVADSTPAPTTLLAPTDPQEYATWRSTGKLPEPKEGKPKEASTPSPESSSGSPEEKIAPAPEAGKTKQEPRSRSDAETRLAEVLADLSKAGLTPKELKTFKREAQQVVSGEKDAPPASSTAPELKAPVKPDFKNWKGTWVELEAAKEKYYDELGDYKVAKALQDFQRTQATQALNARMAARVAAAAEHYGGGAARDTIVSTAQTLFAKDSPLPGVVHALIDQSPVIEHLLYTLGSKAEDLAEFIATAKSNPGQAVRKVVLMEQLIQDELAKGGKKPDAEKTDDPAAGERDENGRFKTPVRQVTKAPPPPREVSGRAVVPPDGIDSAVSDGDFRAFQAKSNARDLARRRGQ